MPENYTGKRILFLVLLLVTATSAIAQDIQFSQFYATPMYINPAFAGSRHNLRATVNQRYQWPGLQANFNTSFFSIDGYSAKYQSGFGLSVIHDEQGSNALVSNEIQGMYSYELHISSKYTARGGVQLGYIMRTPGYQLIFPSQLNDAGLISGAANPLAGASNNIGMPDVSAGGILYSDRMWVSLSSNHINTPKESLINQDNFLPVKFTLATGYKIPIKQADHGLHHDKPNDISITPTLNYKRQGNNDQVDIGLYGIYNWVMAGLWYRGIPFKKYDPAIQNNESVVILAGFHYEGFTFGYSYDITVSTLSQPNTLGSHEINLTYVFDKHKAFRSPKLMKRLPCPDFYHHFNEHPDEGGHHMSH